ncbi:MAG: LysR substrate-binding domain-containing protein [Thermoplasmata archaeon]
MPQKKPDLKELEAFYAVASTLSFSKGAMMIDISQSSASIRISSLERKYGQKLFYRNGWSIQLTPKGRVLFEKVKKLLDYMNEIENVMSSPDETKIIRISAGESTFLSMFPNITEDYKISHPGIDFSVDINETLKSIENLKIGVADLIFVGWISEGIYDRSLFDVIELGEDELVLIVPVNHPLAALEKVSLDQICKYDYLARRKTSGVQHAIMDMFYNAGFRETDLNVRGIMDNASSVIMAVYKNMGISIVSRMQTTVATKMKVVKVVGIDSPNSRRKVYAMFKKTADPYIKEFAEYSAQYFSQHNNLQSFAQSSGGNKK